MPKDYQFDTVLYGANYSLYTHSFLCYGVNEAAIRLQAVLIEVSTNCVEYVMWTISVTLW